MSCKVAMDRPAVLPPDIWEWTLPKAQAYIRVLEARVATLEGLKQGLQVQLKQTSRNSSRPPSSPPPSRPRPHCPRHQSPTAPRLGTPMQRQRPKPMRSSPSSCAHPLYYGPARDILAPIQATTRITEETPHDEERFAASLAHRRDRCVARHVAQKRKRRRLSVDGAERKWARERLRWAGGRGRRRECHLFQSRWPDPHPARAGRWRAASRQAFY